MKTRFGFLVIALQLLALGGVAFAGPLGPEHKTFIQRENINDHFEIYKNDPRFTTVRAHFLPGESRVFDVKYIEIPLNEINVVDSGLGAPGLRDQVFIERDGVKHYRFYIHPESEQLYADLIKRYGVRGSYLATPTASTRTLLAWDPHNPNAPPLFLKLSLAQKQFGLGRIVPDWEVRRSVSITKLAAAIPEADRKKYGVEIIPEIAGAYIDKALGAGYFIDDQQFTVFEHGMIVRDAEFLKQYPNHELYPLFALFSKRGLRKPLLLKWWIDSKTQDFYEFVDKTVLEPVVRALGYLIFEQGIIPDAHGQNIVVAVNPKTRQIEFVLNRDIGSMKVDLLLRWTKGLPMADLRTFNTDYDYKFRWASEAAGKSLMSWFYKYMFTDYRGQAATIKAFMPSYEPTKIYELLSKRLQEALVRHLPRAGHETATILDELAVQNHIERYRAENAPMIRESKNVPVKMGVHAFLVQQAKLGQTLEFPKEWVTAELRETLHRKGHLITDYGVLYPTELGPRIAFLPPEGIAPIAADRPTHVETLVHVGEVFASQSFRTTGDVSRKVEEAVLRGEVGRDALPVIRAGTPERPIYQLLAGVEHLLVLRESFEVEQVRVNVLFDITGLPEDKQRQILTTSGDFWSPMNREGKYERIRAIDLPRSPWADLAWTFEPKELEVMRAPEPLQFRDVAIARHVYEGLKLRTEANIDAFTEAFRIRGLAIMTDWESCETLLNPR